MFDEFLGCIGAPATSTHAHVILALSHEAIV